MDESILNALMQLFAIIVDVQKVGKKGAAREVVASYLEKQFNKEWLSHYLDEFDQYLQQYHETDYHEQSLLFKRRQIQQICAHLVEDVAQEQKVWLLLQLMEFIDDSELTGDQELDFVNIVAKAFKVPQQEYENSRGFILGDQDTIPINDRFLIIDGHKQFSHPTAKHMFNGRMRGKLFVLHLPTTDTFLIKYFGKHNLFLNGHNVKLNRTYLFPVGAVIRSPRMDPVYYSQVAGMFIQGKYQTPIHFVADEIEFRFNGSDNGVHRFSFMADSGQLIGIMGGSGTGKSTLLNVLNGTLPLHHGRITINGHDLHEDDQALKGVIGYVPQEDLLIEELTVYENLFFNAKLCFNDFSNEQIQNLVDEVVEKFDLVEARELKVGDPVNKILSGGQRKRLNIALELMREPSILFVDEPTSGLSSMDSEKVMILLKRQVVKGKLVMCNIHQPSSDLFKLLDKLIILDQGGRVIYFGNPVDAVVYFKTQSHFVKPDESECLSCGNVNSEQIFRIVEARMMNEYGKQIRKRKRNPKDWEYLYRKNIEANNPIHRPHKKHRLPKNFFQIPLRIKQLKIYLERDVRAKLSNHQYMLITLLEAPLLAVILGFFTKYISGSESDPNAYVFANNENLPAYLFMSVVVALFLGLIISAEEIMHDRRIIKREKFLNLSRLSYLNSKVLVLMGISAIQTFLFVLLANLILEVKGLNMEYWAILFTASTCANLIGLNLSAALKSVVAVYVSIPFILVPQLLFSGVIVDFNKLHHNIANQDYVPIVGDLMTSRWAYEALVVTQFRDNEFERIFYPIEQSMSESSYMASYLVPELQRRVSRIARSTSGNSKLKSEQFHLLRHELSMLRDQLPPIQRGSLLLDSTAFNLLQIDAIKQSLEQIKQSNWQNYHSLSRERDEQYNKLSDLFGGSVKTFRFKQKYHNDALATLVLNRHAIKKIVPYKNRLIQKKDPIFRIPQNSWGRAHFYAPVKRIGPWLMDTFWFNLLVIWIFSALLYVILYGDLLRRFFNYLETMWLRIIPEGEFRLQRKRL